MCTIRGFAFAAAWNSSRARSTQPDSSSRIAHACKCNGHALKHTCVSQTLTLFTLDAVSSPHAENLFQFFLIDSFRLTSLSCDMHRGPEHAKDAGLLHICHLECIGRPYFVEATNIASVHLDSPIHVALLISLDMQDLCIHGLHGVVGFCRRDRLVGIPLEDKTI